MLEYASMRFTESCLPATRFATVMVRTLTHARTGGHPAAHDVDCGSPKTVNRIRSIIPNAAVLTATAMKVVAGVGAPSYASGVHMWNGTALTLKTRPAIRKTIPKITPMDGAPPCVGVAVG